MDDLSGTSIKGYELLEQIGQGGFGQSIELITRR